MFNKKIKKLNKLKIVALEQPYLNPLSLK